MIVMGGALVFKSRSKVSLLLITVDCIMTQHKYSCFAAVLVPLCITFMPGGTSGCTGEAICAFCVKYWNHMIDVVL